MNLMKYLPFYYQDINEIVDLQNSIGIEYQSLRDRIDDVFNQCFIETTTWGIQLWERLYGVPVGDTTSNLDDRREYIIAKMRSEGTTTVEKIKRLALSFTNGKIDVEEHYAQYMITIRFTSIVGRISNLENFEKALKVIIPAHLGYSLVFRYNMHIELKKHRLTHGSLRRYTHQQIFETRVFED